MITPFMELILNQVLFQGWNETRRMNYIESNVIRSVFAFVAH